MAKVTDSKATMSNLSLDPRQFHIQFALVGNGRRDFVEVSFALSCDDIPYWRVTAYDNPCFERWYSKEPCFREHRKYANPMELLEHIGVELVDLEFFKLAEQLKPTGKSNFSYASTMRQNKPLKAA